jgi:hypothetical protein
VLLREHNDSVIAIGQASHAWVAGQLARAWGNERFAAPSPREEVCLAAEQHDVGMAEWDLRPSLNPHTHRPYSFTEMPVATHVQLWAAAPAKLLSQSRYAALLVSMHGTALNERRDWSKLNPVERRVVGDYLEGQRRLQNVLARQLRADHGELARNQRLVWTWDSMSLALCLRWQAFAVSDLPGSESRLELELATAVTAGDRFTADPWPFAAERVEVRCEGRLLMGRFDSEAQLHQTLARSEVVRLIFTLEGR